jgi:phospholipase D1/2
MWPGQDYCNPRFAQYQSVEIPFKDVIERENVPRMPWHDVHLGLRTHPCYHHHHHHHHHYSRAAQTGRQRAMWRSTLCSGGTTTRQLTARTRTHSCTPKQQSMPLITRVSVAKFVCASPTPLTGTCSVQLVRSICEWSGGNRTEDSILQACAHLALGAGTRLTHYRASLF